MMADGKSLGTLRTEPSRQVRDKVFICLNRAFPITSLTSDSSQTVPRGDCLRMIWPRHPRSVGKDARKRIYGAS